MKAQIRKQELTICGPKVPTVHFTRIPYLEEKFRRQEARIQVQSTNLMQSHSKVRL